MGLLTPYSVPRGRFLYTMIVPGGERVFAPFKSCSGGLSMEMVLDELIPALRPLHFME